MDSKDNLYQRNIFLSTHATPSIRYAQGFAQKQNERIFERKLLKSVHNKKVHCGIFALQHFCYFSADIQANPIWKVLNILRNALF